MPRLAILLAGTSLGVVVLNTLVGILAGLRYIEIRTHTLLAIPTSVLALGSWTVVVLHFVGSHAWVRETVAGGGLDRALVAQSAAIRRAILPWVSAAVLVLIAAYVLGGGADTGAVPPLVHFGLAVLALLLHLVACYRTIILVGMSVDLSDQIDRSVAGR